MSAPGTFIYAAAGKVWWPAQVLLARSEHDEPGPPVLVDFFALVTPRRRKEKAEQAATTIGKLSQSLAAALARGESADEITAKAQELATTAVRDEDDLAKRVHGWSGIELSLPDGSKHAKYDAEAFRFAIGDEALYAAFAAAVEGASKAALAKN